MPEHPMKVFILKHTILVEHPAEPCSEDGHLPEYTEVVAASNAFADWLAKSVAMFGTAFRGPLIGGDGVVEDYYILCLHLPWPEMHRVSVLQARQAKGEIFVADQDVYYAQPETLTLLGGEVLGDWYYDEHGTAVSDLEADLRRRLSRSCHFELRSLGYNGTTIRQLTPRWIDAVYKRRPAEWDWAWFADTLKEVVRDFGVEAEEEKHGWFVYEALEENGGPDIFPPVENGELILEVTEALVDEAGESRQWLVRAKALFEHGQIRYPEFESIRPLEKHEIFSSRRGVFWSGDSGGVMLGEIGGDMLHERHGEIVEDVDDRLRAYIMDSLTGQIESRSGCDDFSRIIEVIDDELNQIDVCELWFHDLAPLAERAIEVLKTSAP